MFDSMYDSIVKDPQALGQVVGAVIGVVGLFVGTFITIFTSFIIRGMDVRREERRETAEIEKARKEKEFLLKQKIYSHFISELASLENFITKKSAVSHTVTNLENFDNEWTRIEIKVDLVSSEKVKDLKDDLSQQLMSLAKQRFASKEGKEVALSPEYMQKRSELLEAIRQDMEINKK